MGTTWADPPAAAVPCAAAAAPAPTLGTTGQVLRLGSTEPAACAAADETVTAPPPAPLAVPVAWIASGTTATSAALTGRFGLRRYLGATSRRTGSRTAICPAPEAPAADALAFDAVVAGETGLAAPADPAAVAAGDDGPGCTMIPGTLPKAAPCAKAVSPNGPVNGQPTASSGTHAVVTTNVLRMPIPAISLSSRATRVRRGGGRPNGRESVPTSLPLILEKYRWNCGPGMAAKAGTGSLTAQREYDDDAGSANGHLGCGTKPDRIGRPQ